MEEKTNKQENDVNQEKNINKDEETRHVMSNPIAKGVETSIAMGIDTTDAPLPLWFNTKADNDKS